jgi:hypothetical protein
MREQETGEWAFIRHSRCSLFDPDLPLTCGEQSLETGPTGPDLDESYKRAAALADAILKGARPTDLSVEEPTRFILAVNLKTAAALALTVPPRSSRAPTR